MLVPVLLVIGIILAMSGVAIMCHFEKFGLVVVGIGFCFLLSSIPLAIHESNKPKTYEVTEISCYESYHEEQLVRVMVESPLYKGYYFYMYMTPSQFNKFKVEGEMRLSITDNDLKMIPRTNNKEY